jgi:hypothetical protein
MRQNKGKHDTEEQTAVVDAHLMDRGEEWHLKKKQFEQ